MAIPLLIKYGADVNAKADNGHTPLKSLYKNGRSVGAKEQKRTMAQLLVLLSGVRVEDQEVLHWLNER